MMNAPIFTNLHILLNQEPDEWHLALQIPAEELSVFSLCPPRWMAYLAFTITGCRGVLLGPDLTPVDLDDSTSIDISQNNNYYYRHEGDLSPVDLAIERRCIWDSSSDSGRCGDFASRVTERDGNTCVLSGGPPLACDAVHLIRFSLGDEYITHLTTKRKIGNDPIIKEIDDVRNGILVNCLIHRYLGRSAAFLKVPNLFLEARHVCQGAVDQASSQYHFQVFDKTLRVGEFNKMTLPHNRPARLPQTCEARESMPTHTVLAILYGFVALKTWGVDQFMTALQERWPRFYSEEVHSSRDGGAEQVKRDMELSEQKTAQHAQERADRTHARDRMIFDALLMLPSVLDPGRAQRMEERRREAEELEETASRARVDEWLKNGLDM
ncbi:uncharacterized protein LAESUDRAFT_560332 [Laetiporus sulphureus 93-53]|uniref:HNH nuclease domain-containing protein n=1 Tax=Laetiporus sulphureus 93-53 TaxID=1314785 RepID=A0A165B5H0_9APHY|nr:uncharacterized protein LAESUDRAFT_560332 [Laetiporus sulphureus 93-53]KZT00283.1 hypothetical protein LAESUDRAFT_560332 [Laetiporus sulphureus 93-53]